MARQPALNEEALVKLGSEKLARLVIGEAKRHAAFRKLVAAALAATKGPAEYIVDTTHTPCRLRVAVGGRNAPGRWRARH